MSQLVSILIPAYNCEKWIAETIESALAQTWPNKEIIIVNDGSTDNTLQIAKQFESKSVKVISQENKGAAAARNRAFEHAQGDYIQWLDADDLLAPGKIAEQMKIAGNGKTDLTLYTSPFGTFYWHTERAIFASNTLWQDLTPVEWMIRRFTENLWMHPGVWLISRALAEKAGPWDERLSLNDDGEYISRVVAASENVKFVNTAICYYRQWSFTQLSRQYNKRKGIESHYLSTITSIQSLSLL
jgi:glycosyltransferase involved in cell wall biosynthesis